MRKKVYIRGAGDLATGIACRLYDSGLSVIMTEISKPTTVRRTVAFSSAIFDGTTVVEGKKSVYCLSKEEMRSALDKREIPIVVEHKDGFLNEFEPDIVVDAIVAKKNIATTINDANIVIAVGPGFAAGIDCHCVIESMRGHDLGRCIYSGSAKPNTGIPGDVGGFSEERIIRARGNGSFYAVKGIGDKVEEGELVGYAGDCPIFAAATGILRGLLHDGVTVESGMKAGDVDPRAEIAHCFTVSDKARAIGGGVLEAILHLTDF